MEKLLLSPRDVAKILGIGLQKSYELFRRPDFPTLKLGKLIRVTKEALDEWITRQIQTKEVQL